jgi:hypothetical protein
MLLSLIALAAATYTGPSLRVGGGADGLNVPFSPALQVTGDLTLEAWIKPQEQQPGGPFHFIVSQNYSGAGYALVLIGRGDDYRLQFEANEIVPYFVPMRVLKQGWWHVAGVMHGGKRIRLLINGVVVADKETKLTMMPSTRPLTMGTSPWDGFAGNIGEVRVWNVARSQDEIVRDMNARLTGKEPGLVALWDFRHTAKNEVYDLTHHTKPGVLIGKARLVRAPRRAR